MYNRRNGLKQPDYSGGGTRRFRRRLLARAITDRHVIPTLPSTNSPATTPSFLHCNFLIIPKLTLFQSQIPNFAQYLQIAMADRQSTSASSAQPIQPSPSRRRLKKYRSIKDIIDNADVERHDYNDAVCDQCGSGDRDHQLLLCDKCDKAYHMLCLRPIVVRVPIGSWYCPACSDHPPPLRKISGFTQTKIFDFFKIKKCTASSVKRISPQDSRRRRRRTGAIVHHKRRRRLLPYTPSEDTKSRLEQMRSLASALTHLSMEFSDDLTYSFDMAPRWANLAMFEDGGMQVLSKEDTKTLEYCRTMLKRGECPPLLVVYDSCEGYTVEADGPIKDMTLITEYTGDVDFIKNREHDDCDSMMTLLLASNPSKSLVICPDKRGNIARFINGVNNFTPEAKKKQNLKCVRYSVYGECRVLLVATRDIAKGERLYYDYNGYEHEYPTHHFV